MAIKRAFFIFLVLMVLTAACQQAGVPAGTQKAAPTPESGKGTVIGRVISVTDSKPYADTTVILAQIYGEGDDAAYVVDTSHSPAGRTDQDGNFVILNVPPARYALIVGDPTLGPSVAFPDVSNNNKTKFWTVEADKVLDLTTLSVPPAK